MYSLPRATRIEICSSSRHKMRANDNSDISCKCSLNNIAALRSINTVRTEQGKNNHVKYVSGCQKVAKYKLTVR